MSAVLKAFLMVIVLLAFFYAREYFMRRGRLMTEFYILGLFAAIGMMVLISAHNLLTVYLGLELLSLSLYAMVAMDRDSITGVGSRNEILRARRAGVGHAAIRDVHDLWRRWQRWI